jgi:hypothetical protein
MRPSNDVRLITNIGASRRAPPATRRPAIRGTVLYVGALVVGTAATIALAATIGPDPPPSSPPWFMDGNVLAGMYLWLLFGFFSSMMSTDVQRLLKDPEQRFIHHLVAYLAFFFLISVLEPQKALLLSLGKAIVVYLLFVLSTKCTAVYSALILSALVVDQMVSRATEQTGTHARVRVASVGLMYLVAIVGCVRYARAKMREKKEAFDWWIFFQPLNSVTTNRPVRWAF